MLKYSRKVENKCKATDPCGIDLGSGEEFEQITINPEFIDKSLYLNSEYICTICCNILIDASIDDCGHLFCKQCIKKHLNIIQACPISGHKLVIESINRLPYKNQIIMQKEVFCSNKDYECEWRGPLNMLNNHLKLQCQFQLLRCPYSLCGESVPKEKFENHKKCCVFAPWICQYCEHQIESNLRDTHYEDCQNFRINCINNCGELVMRKEQKNHLTVCNNKVVNCIFTNSGCKFSSNLKCMAKHIKDNQIQHFLFFMNDSKLKLSMSSKIIAKLKSIIPQKRIDELLSLKGLRTGRHQMIYRQHEKDIKFNRNSLDDSNADSVDVEGESESDGTFEKPGFMRRKRVFTEFSNENEYSEKEDSRLDCNDMSKSKQFKRDRIHKNIEMTVDKLHISRGLKVSNLTVKLVSNYKNEHKFAFMSVMLNQINFRWGVRLEEINGWMAFGICCKDLVASNKFAFVSNKLKFNHFCYMISSNGYSWNASNEQENNRKVHDLKFGKGDVFHLTYSCTDKSILFENDHGFSHTLTKIEISNQILITPVICMINVGDSVSFEPLD